MSTRVNEQQCFDTVKIVGKVLKLSQNETLLKIGQLKTIESTDRNYRHFNDWRLDQYKHTTHQVWLNFMLVTNIDHSKMIHHTPCCTAAHIPTQSCMHKTRWEGWCSNSGVENFHISINGVYCTTPKNVWEEASVIRDSYYHKHIFDVWVWLHYSDLMENTCSNVFRQRVQMMF